MVKAWLVGPHLAFLAADMGLFFYFHIPLRFVENTPRLLVEHAQLLDVGIQVLFAGGPISVALTKLQKLPKSLYRSFQFLNLNVFLIQFALVLKEFFAQFDLRKTLQFLEVIQFVFWSDHLIFHASIIP